MVSRPGRSKACSNCRRRRIKCDETRPFCKRCLKTGLPCDGPKGMIWVDEHSTIVVTSSSSYCGLPDGISFVAFEDDVCFAYTRRHLMKGGCVDLACDLIGPGLNKGPDLLRKSLLGLSAAFYGSQHCQKAILKRGYMVYGEVLKQLNSHLAQPQLQTTDETILTAIVCMLLEIFVPTGPNNFFKHVRGIEAILAVRGPPTSPTGVNPAMLSGIRILCIIGALVQNRSSMWATDEWKRIPPSHFDEDSLIRHEILEILADCTVVRSEHTRIPLTVAKSQGYACNLIAARGFLDKLRSIYSRWEKYNASMLYTHVSASSKDLSFANRASTATYMLYNSALICVLRTISVYDSASENASLQVAASLNIVQCLELKAHDKHHEDGESRTIAFIATKFAWETLGGNSTPDGRRLSRAVKSGTNRVTAVSTWEY